MVILSIRLESKEKTRQLILDATKLLIQENGFVKISSKDISSKCNVSQGTLFLHFTTKHNLLTTVLNSNIEKFEIDIKSNINSNDDQMEFIKDFIEVFANHEDILSRVYKDYSYLTDDIMKKMDNIEITLKNLVFDNYKRQNKNSMNIIDSFIAIDAFLSQIKEYLISKQTFSSSNSVMRQKRGRIVKLFKMLF